jgi:hypothetical protein
MSIGEAHGIGPRKASPAWPSAISFRAKCFSPLSNMLKDFPKARSPMTSKPKKENQSVALTGFPANADR